MAVSEAVHRLHNKIGGKNLAAMCMSGHLHIHRRLHVGEDVAGAVVKDDDGQVAAHAVEQFGKRLAVFMRVIITPDQHQAVGHHHRFFTQEMHAAVVQRLRIFLNVAIELMVAQRRIHTQRCGERL